MNKASRRQFFKTAGSAAGVSLIGAGEARPQPASERRTKLTLACADYLRMTPLATGDVRPKDIDLTWLRGPRAEMLRRASSDPTVHGGEASMLQHLLRLDAGDRSLVAIPVFPLRNFTARDLYTRKGSPLLPAVLNGRRVGIYNWAASGAVWYRHLVRYYGQDPAKITWIVGGVDQAASVASRAPLPPHVSHAPVDKSLSDLLLAREIDAIFSPLPPKAYHALNGPIVRVLPDFVSVERRYFKDTRCYPPQHVLLLRRETWEKDPKLGSRLLEAFEDCEARFQEAQHLFPYATPWQIADVEEADLAMGRDYHAHGFETNRHALDVFCVSAFTDGLTKRRLTVEDYFAEFLKQA